jgi:hypothetical protein
LVGESGLESVLGARELRRLARALDARGQFHQLMPAKVPQFEIPLLESEEERLVEDIAGVLRLGPAAAGPPVPARGAAVLRTSVPPPEFP